MMTSAVVLRGSGPLPSAVLSVLAGLPYILVVGGLLFGMVAAAVRLARSRALWRRTVAVMFGLAFLLAGMFVVLMVPAPTNSLSTLIGAVLVVPVAAAGALFVSTIAAESGSSLTARLVAWRRILMVASLALGVVGIISWMILNAPVQEIGQSGIRAGDLQRIDQLTIWTALRDRGPIAVCLLAAALGAITWRVARQAQGAAAALFGCVGVGLNLWLLFLQSGD